ncbi:MAG: hypothetical protein V3V18_13975 [Methylococcales bacterium]
MSCDEIYDSVVNYFSTKKPSDIQVPSERVIQLLSPYISQNLGALERNDIVRNDIKNNISNFVQELCTLATKDPDKKGALKKELIDELKHLVSHYAKKECIGPQVADYILDELANSLITQSTTTEINNPIKFDDISDVRQAYWDRRKHNDKILRADKHRMHRTIRINGMPFAEGVLVYLMEYYADNFAINLEIIDIPWRDVGTALLTNRIDVAFYNKSIEEQMKGLHRLLDNRLLFRSDKVFTYKTYYFLSKTTNPKKPDLSNMTEPSIAVVSYSDHVEVLTNWCKFFYPDDWKKPFERAVFPVRSPDEALRMVVDGVATYCIAGGIHAQYASNSFPGLLQQDAISKCHVTPVYFWTVSSRADDCKRILKDMISLWIQVESEWLTLKNGQDANNKDLQSRCVTYVNRQPNQAFVIPGGDIQYDDLFTKNLAQLINKHDVFHRPSVNEFILTHFTE